MSFEFSNKRKRRDSLANQSNSSGDERPRARSHQHRRIEVDERDIGPYSEWEEPDVDLFKLLKAKQQELAFLDLEVSEKKETKRILKQKQMEIQKRCDHTRHELEIVIQDLMASRIYAPMEGTMRIEDVIQGFVSLSKDIHEFMRNLWLSLQSHLNWSLSGAEIQTLALHFQESLEYKDPSHFLEAMSTASKVPAHMVVLGIARHLFYSTIHDFVFEYIAPGLIDEDVRLLSLLYEQIRTQESQELCSRWRAMTYAAVARDRPVDLWKGHAEFFLDQVAVVIRAVTDGQFISEDFYEERLAESEIIFRRAAEFQDRIRTMCLDAECTPMMPKYGQAFDGKYMVDMESAEEKATIVLLPIAWAILVSKVVMDGSNNPVEDTNIPLSARVIADNWNPHGLIR